MEDQFWKYFAYAWLIIQTLCLIIILDILAFGKPYLTLFVMIFVCIFRFNLSRKH